jgi:Zn-dependent M28 family amino/carboxypeptidase
MLEASPVPIVLVAVLAGAPLPAELAHREATSRILGTALSDGRAHEKLAYLTDRIGHRLSGSAALDRAIAWAARTLREDGLDRVWTEPVMVPRWVRGHEAAAIVAPVERELALLGLGGTVATPDGGLRAAVVEVDGLERLADLGTTVQGKLVLFNKAMGAGLGAEPGYGTVVKLRSEGPSAAARQGAVGMLLRSLGTANFRLPHTGALKYEDDAPRIPAAAIAAEDAELIHRLLAAGDRVEVRLELHAQTLADAASANVLAELTGRERPAEVVLIGAHLDSWDVGQGAQDDGAGCAVVLETMSLLRRLDLRPRRTIRAVLFTNEENGLRGAKDYARRHGGEPHVVAIESDSGGAAPVGFGVEAGPGAVETVRELAAPLAAIGCAHVLDRGGGADLGPLKDLGVPVMSLRQDSTHYFDVHHSAADTLDKVTPRDLDRNVAALAWMAWALAERERPLPTAPPAGAGGD